MDYSLSSEQEMLKRSVRDFLAEECKFEVAKAMATDERGCPEELWQKVAGLGWTGLPIPERYGGAEAGLVDLAVLVEELGRVNFPHLFLSAVVLGGLSILEAGSEEQKAALLPKVADGSLISTLALLEPSLSYEPSAIRAAAIRSGTGYAISGTKLLVPDAHLADYLICAARTADRAAESEGLSLLLIPAKAAGVSLTPLRTMAGDKQFAVVFAETPAEVLGEADAAWPALRRVQQVAAVMQCAEMVGAAQRILDLAVEHGHNRIQFGRPVGSFQAVQHHCANICTDLDLGRFLTHQAAWMLSERSACAKQVSIAKAFVGDAYLRVVSLGHEVLGGNGLIEEHEMPLFSKRAPGAQQLFGSSDYHRELVVQALGL